MSEQLLRDIAWTVQHHRTYNFDADSGFTIHLPLSNAREWDELSKKRGDWSPASDIKDGDTGTLLGLKFVVDANLPRDRVFIGYRVIPGESRTTASRDGV